MNRLKKAGAIVFVISILGLAACTTDNPQADEETAETQLETNEEDMDTIDETSESDNSSTAGLKVGIAAREITNDYNRSIIEAAQEAIEAAGGTVTVTDAQTDVQKHNENIENLINSGIDALLVHLGDPEQLAPLMELAKSKNIPVITAGVGAPIPDTLGDVNGDDALMATLAADALLGKINYEGEVYIVWVPGAPLLETRKRIFEAIVEDYPGVTLHEVPAEHNPAKVQTLIEEILAANPEEGSIAGIFGTYDQLVSGASEAIRRAGRGDEISLVGIDGDVLSFQMLFQEDGPFVASVVMDTESIGIQSVEILLDAVNNGTDEAAVPQKFPSSCYVATRKNGVDAAEMKWGTAFWENAGLIRDEVEKQFPVTEDVIVMYPIVP